jgi:imidazolonepropionase-like amidohydrolase
MVVVLDGRIVECGPRDDVEAFLPNEVRRFDFPNSTLLPGLINSHVHLAFDTSDDPVAVYKAAGSEELIGGIAGRAVQVLDAGITTIRDLGGPAEVFAVRDSIASG